MIGLYGWYDEFSTKKMVFGLFLT